MLPEDASPNLPEEEMDVQLWAYIDGLLPATEQQALEAMIAENSSWRSRYKELLEVQASLMELELEQPSLRFTQNVMDEIQRLQIAPATREYINKKIIWGIAGFFITLIVGFVGFALSQVDWAAGGENNTLLDTITGADYSKIFNNSFVNGFMMLNVILGLMLFDRYLNNKRKQFAPS